MNPNDPARIVDVDALAAAFGADMGRAKSAIGVTPVDFGAVGDGVTDDRPAFVALNAAGGKVYLPKPPVRYNLSSPLDMTNVAVTVDPAATWSQVTGDGMLTWKRGNISTAAVHRLSDRVFIGEAACRAAGNSASGDASTEWYMDRTNHAGYLGINAQMLVAGGNLYKMVGATRASDHTAGSLVFGAIVEGDVPGRVMWGGIAELTRKAGMLYGWEVSAKNQGDNARMTPNTKPQGVYGMWLASGGDNLFGGAATAPGTAAVVIHKNDDMPWNSGIVFNKDGLTDGEAIALSSEGDGGAHLFRWYNAAGNSVFSILSNATDAVGWDMRRTNNGFEVRSAGKTLFQVGAVTGANAGVVVFPSNGGAPQIAPIGDAADIDLRLSSKGAGLVRYGVYAAQDDAPVTGYITIKDAGGALRKLAVIA